MPHGRVRQADEGAHLRGRHRLDHDDGAALEGAPPQEPRAKLGLIVVDYLQLMTSGGTVENRVQEVSQISRNLKVLARDLDVPILALSQLSRAVEQRHDKRPILSDLRESGSIEQDADLVLFVYRDEYYNGEESDSQGLAELILAKHRNGPTDAIKLSFLKRYAKFTDLAGTRLMPRRGQPPPIGDSTPATCVGWTSAAGQEIVLADVLPRAHGGADRAADRARPVVALRRRPVRSRLQHVGLALPRDPLPAVDDAGLPRRLVAGRRGGRVGVDHRRARVALDLATYSARTASSRYQASRAY